VIDEARRVSVPRPIDEQKVADLHDIAALPGRSWIVALDSLIATDEFPGVFDDDLVAANVGRGITAGAVDLRLRNTERVFTQRLRKS